MTLHSADPDLSEHERSVLTRLEGTGWFINNIFADERNPGFAYSFGLYENSNTLKSLCSACRETQREI